MDDYVFNLKFQTDRLISEIEDIKNSSYEDWEIGSIHDELVSKIAALRENLMILEKIAPESNEFYRKWHRYFKN